ncbi:MAG: hypothetical protein RLY21_1876, partial [Planctomycetota bacterium]
MHLLRCTALVRSACLKPIGPLGNRRTAAALLGFGIQSGAAGEAACFMLRLTTSVASLFAALLLCTASPASAQSGPAANLEFESGTKGWQTVLDGVMGGRSTGRIAAGEGGTLRFTGELSLENNGGFSQIRTAVPEGTFSGKTGLVLRV